MALSFGVSPVHAADVNLSGENSFKTLAAADGSANPNICKSGTLTLTTGASINCNDNTTDQPTVTSTQRIDACDIAIIVTGDLVMEPCRAIRAENSAPTLCSWRITTDPPVGLPPAGALRRRIAAWSNACGSC